MLHEMRVPQYYKPMFQNDLKVVPIAPAPEKMELEKPKYTYKSNPYVGAQAASIARRNARERNRVKQVNDSFSALRKRLPAAVISALSGGSRRGSGKKLSKVDTLRMVVEYIRYMENLLEDNEEPLASNAVETKFTLPQEIDEGVGRMSPYSESVSSPAYSECSSGVSSGYSNGNGYLMNSYPAVVEPVNPMDDDELLDAITWWQQK